MSTIVPRSWRREVPERLAPDGTVEIPLDVTAVLREVEGLVAEGVRSLAVCFLHAYANPAHERTAAAAIAEHFPDLSLSLSSDIAPEIREYPRMVTSVANAYVRPLAETYFDHLEAALHGAGIPGSLFLMLSNGGLTHVAEAKRAPVQLLEGSPAAGDPGIEFWGNSFVADPFGQVVSQAGSENEEILVVECDPAKSEETRRGWPFFRDRRIDAYQPILNRWLGE